MYPIFFNIYGIKLNEIYFCPGAVIINFCDKLYPEMNILFRVFNLMMNKTTRGLMDISNKVKRYKI